MKVQEEEPSPTKTLDMKEKPIYICDDLELRDESKSIQFMTTTKQDNNFEESDFSPLDSKDESNLQT